MDNVMINMLSEDDSFVNQLRAKEGAVCVNKDLVGEPLSVGIYDETTGKVVVAVEEVVVPDEGEEENNDGDEQQPSEE